VFAAYGEDTKKNGFVQESKDYINRVHGKEKNFYGADVKTFKELVEGAEAAFAAEQKKNKCACISTLIIVAHGAEDPDTGAYTGAHFQLSGEQKDGSQLAGSIVSGSALKSSPTYIALLARLKKTLCKNFRVVLMTCGGAKGGQKGTSVGKELANGLKGAVVSKEGVVYGRHYDGREGVDSGWTRMDDR
jgi:hypothetical protein